MKSPRAVIILFVTLLISLAGCSTYAEEIERRVSGTQTAIVLARNPEAAKTLEAISTEELDNTPTPSTSPRSSNGTTISDGECTPGSTIILPGGDVEPSYVDLVQIDSSLEGEELTIVFHVQQIPQDIIINRETIPDWTQEYAWFTVIDLLDHETEGNAPEYLLSLEHVKMESSEEITMSFSTAFQDAIVYRLTEDGYLNQLSNGTSSIDIEASTITISGRIPRITENTHLQFGAVFTSPDGNNSGDFACH